MKYYSVFFGLALATLSFISCGGNDNDGEDGSGNSVVGNANCNVPAIGQSIEITRLGFPKVKGGASEVVVHSTSTFGMTYALEWDHEKRSSRWCCYEIKDGNHQKVWERSGWKKTDWLGDPFQHDPKIPAKEQPPVNGEFSGSYFPDHSGKWFDRGHIVASEDRVYSKDANEQTFYMTNMQPQVHAFNAGIWLKMEACVRDHFSKGSIVYVCKGGTIDDEKQILMRTKSNFIVPRYFFMAVMLKNNDGYHAFGFWVEHRNEERSKYILSNYVVNIDELEQKTGIDFFCNLPDDVENQMEGESIQSVKSYFRSWGINQTASTVN